MNGETSNISANELALVAGGCKNCELNPPQFNDVLIVHPTLYIDVGINDDLRVATL